jgi:hypothetical protein
MSNLHGNKIMTYIFKVLMWYIPSMRLHLVHAKKNCLQYFKRTLRKKYVTNF